MLAIAALMVLCGHRLRVYHNVTVVEVTVLRILPDGTRQAVATPAPFERFESGYAPGHEVPQRIERAIERYMDDLQQHDPPGTRYEWTVLYSADSTKLDRRHVVVREVRVAGH